MLLLSSIATAALIFPEDGTVVFQIVRISQESDAAQKDSKAYFEINLHRLDAAWSILYMAESKYSGSSSDDSFHSSMAIGPAISIREDLINRQY